MIATFVQFDPLTLTLASELKCGILYCFDSAQIRVSPHSQNRIPVTGTETQIVKNQAFTDFVQ